MVGQIMEVRLYDYDSMRNRISFNEEDFELIINQRWHSSKNSLRLQTGTLSPTEAFEYYVQIESHKPVNVFIANLVSIGSIADSEGWILVPTVSVAEDYLADGYTDSTSFMYSGTHINLISLNTYDVNFANGLAIRYKKDFILGTDSIDDDLAFFDKALVFITQYTKMCTDALFQKLYGIGLGVFVGESDEPTDVTIKIWRKGLGADSLAERQPS